MTQSPENYEMLAAPEDDIVIVRYARGSLDKDPLMQFLSGLQPVCARFFLPIMIPPALQALAARCNHPREHAQTVMCHVEFAMQHVRLSL